MKKDNLTELAKMLKDREQNTPPSVATGVVLKPPPEPRIRLNDVVVLEKENLVFAAHLLKNYERKVRFEDKKASGKTSSAGDPSHTHDVKEIKIDTKMKWTDTLKEDDEVILIPSMDEQMYYVIDKGVRL